jgi:hypothetical protein
MTSFTSSSSSDLRDEFGEEGANDHARHRAKEAQHHAKGIRRPVPKRLVRVTCTVIYISLFFNKYSLTRSEIIQIVRFYF